MGIPQGSITASILFSIMVHDLPATSMSHDTNIVEYADINHSCLQTANKVVLLLWFLLFLLLFLRQFQLVQLADTCC